MWDYLERVYRSEHAYLLSITTCLALGKLATTEGAFSSEYCCVKVTGRGRFLDSLRFDDAHPHALGGSLGLPSAHSTSPARRDRARFLLSEKPPSRSSHESMDGRIQQGLHTTVFTPTRICQGSVLTADPKHMPAPLRVRRTTSIISIQSRKSQSTHQASVAETRSWHERTRAAGVLTVALQLATVMYSRICIT